MGNTGERSIMYLAGGGNKTWTSGPTTITGSYKAIYICRNTAFTSITAADITGATKISSKTTFQPGVVIQGTITKVKVKQGGIFLVN